MVAQVYSYLLCWKLQGLIECLEPIPDLTPLLKPSTLGDFATYFFASIGGLFLGGELGKSASFEIGPV